MLKYILDFFLILSFAKIIEGIGFSIKIVIIRHTELLILYINET